MKTLEPGLVLVDKKWSELKPGECTFWQRQKHAPWNGPEGKMNYATFVLACPKCGSPVELDNRHMVVNVAGRPIWIIGIINCPEETCCSRYYCREGHFEFVRKNAVVAPEPASRRFA